MSLAERLHHALDEAGYTYDRVAELLGATAHAALGRNETTPALRRTRGGSPLETLTRLFLLQAPVARTAAEQALPGLVDELSVHGFLTSTVGEVAARLDVRPYATDDRDLWVASDLTPGLDGSVNHVGADHVLGISSASSSLAQLTVREPVDSALDLGTGCGVQALHLAAHARRVVATDVNARALEIARFNADLNGLAGIEVRGGSFFGPVRGERFDLIATNPPFVISPATGERLVYRDSGLPGDRVVEDIVRAAPEHLTEHGRAQVLANWIIARGTPWDERLAGWLDGTASALVVQREVIDPSQYVELWLRDAGLHHAPDYVERYDTWLSWFEDQGVEAIGFGWINLRRGESGTEFLEWPYDVEQPIAPALAAWNGQVAAAAQPDEALLDTRWRIAPDVVQESAGQPGAEDPETIVLRQQRGLRRATQVDTATAALAGACDGDLTLGQLLDALATLGLHVRLDRVRQLVAEGFLAG